MHPNEDHEVDLMRYALLQSFPSERGFSDKHSVDRATLIVASNVLAALRFPWPTDGGSREATNKSIRASITMQERLEAWRGIVRLPKASRVERGLFASWMPA